jgi:hypothetical protein
MNEVESGTRRAAEGARSGIRSVWDWFTDLGQGSWLLAIGVLAVVAIVVAVVVGRGGASVCDKAVDPVHDLRLHDGNQALQPDAVDQLHTDAQTLDQLASETTGRQHQAMEALAGAAHHARAGQAFHAGAALDAYHAACS